MAYYYSKLIRTDFDTAISRVTEELGKEGFGVVTTLNLQEKFKEKLGVEFRKYTILGACNPVFAHRALTMDDKIGTLLPCNVIVQQRKDGTEISAINPQESMKGILSEELVEFAGKITAKLESVIRKFE